jgi:RNA polymerase sigma-70 factor (ECF subfamily)
MSTVNHHADDSINLMARWQQGDQQAADALFVRYATRLIGLARSRLSSRLAQRVDPEDVVQSVYQSFFVGARSGKFDVHGPGDLWRLLVAMTVNKLQRQVERHTADKRSIEAERSFGGEDSLCGLQPQLFAREPTPEDAAALTDEVEQLMRKLEPLERRMLELRLQGCNLEEIAAATELSERTVCRVLDRVKLHLQASPLGHPA